MAYTEGMRQMKIQFDQFIRVLLCICS